MSKLIWRCPHCDFQTEHVDDLDVAVQHAWEEHGHYVHFRINGEDIRPNIKNSLVRYLMRVLS